MNVRELIEKLQKVDQELNVIVMGQWKFEEVHSVVTGRTGGIGRNYSFQDSNFCFISDTQEAGYGKEWLEGIKGEIV